MSNSKFPKHKETDNSIKNQKKNLIKQNPKKKNSSFNHNETDSTSSSFFLYIPPKLPPNSYPGEFLTTLPRENAIMHKLIQHQHPNKGTNSTRGINCKNGKRGQRNPQLISYSEINNPPKVTRYSPNLQIKAERKESGAGKRRLEISKSIQ